MAIFLKPALGLDISDHSIEAVLMTRKGEQLAVMSYGRASVPAGAIQSGFIEKKDEVRAVIRKLLADLMVPPLPRGIDRVIVALPESQVYSHVFRVPRIADEQGLTQSLAVEADGYFPYPHDVMVASHAVTAQYRDKKDILYAAVHKDTLAGYMELFSSIGLMPSAIEPESASTARAIVGAAESGPVMIVDIGARVANLAFVDGGGIRFSEAIETAGDAFTAAIAAALGIDPAQADALKREQGLELAEPRGRRALEGAADRLIADVKAAMTYCEERFGRPTARVVLCGGSSLMPGLLESFASGLEVEGRSTRFEVADPWKGIEIDPALAHVDVRERGVLATTAIGLAMRGAGVRRPGEIDFRMGAHHAPSPAQVAGVTQTAPAPAAAPAARQHAPTSSAAPRSPLPWLAGAMRGVRHAGSPIWLKLLAAILGVIALATSAWAIAFLRPKPPPVSAPAPLPETVELAAESAFGPVFDFEAGTVTRNRLVVPVRVEMTIQRGGEESEGRAGGRIEVVNDSGSAQTLVASTRFLSEEGVLFRLAERVVVPPRGRVSATLAADAVGRAGDVGPGRFTIPGLPAASQRLIYGVSAEPMRGGIITTAAPFTEDERASILEDLRGDAEAAASEALEAEAGEGRLVLESSVILGEPQLSGMPEIGQAVAEIGLVAAYQVEADSILLSEARSLLEAELAALVPEAPDASPYVVEVDGAEAVTTEDGDARVSVTGRAILRQ